MFLNIDTLIVWQDPDTSVDLALSFQEVAGCAEIWDQIAQIQSLPQDGKMVRFSALNL